MATSIKPAHLKKGDTVAIVAPASPPQQPGELLEAFSRLEDLGLKYQVGKHVFKSWSSYAGTDEERLEDLHEAFSNPKIKAVICVRGGSGSPRLLKKLDFKLIVKNPKIIIGFSDITGLLIPIQQETGLITFHGPMLTSFYQSAYSHLHFVKALMNPAPLGLISDPPAKDAWKQPYPPPRLVISEGKAQGQLTGGCLTLIKQLLGSPYEIDTKGKILFLEDVTEEPHAIDRMLTQLSLSGKLKEAAGIIVGECVDCAPGKSGRVTLPLNNNLETVLERHLSGLGIPVAYGMRFGHGQDKFTLPLGVMASLTVAKGKVRFKIEETATS